MKKYIVTQTQHELLLEALADACDMATAEADYVHEAYRGYKPEKHKYVDDQVKRLQDTYDAVNALKPIEPLSEDQIIVSRKVIEQTLNCLNTPYQADLRLVLRDLYAAIEAHITREKS